jgi:hypothetical protein
VGANNPSHNAYVQSRDLFGDHVRHYILSIGTGEASHPISYEKVSSLGVMGWATEILNIIMKAQSTNTENLMSELSEDNLIGYQRLQGTLPRENYQLDRRDQENLNVLKTAANKLIDSEIFDFTVEEIKNIYHVDDDSFDLKSPQLEEDIINSTRLAIEKRNSQKYERPNL